eukprot:gene9693-biopygen4723
MEQPPPPTFRAAGTPFLSYAEAETVVGKLDQPPVPSAPSARPGRAAGGGGRAARGADLRAGMRPGKSRNSRPRSPPPADLRPRGLVRPRGDVRLRQAHPPHQWERAPGIRGLPGARGFAGAGIRGAAA